jgi:uncharacterized protein
VESGGELVVVGEGSASGPPDRCVLSLALNVAADTSAEALDRVARLADQVIGVTRAQGVAASDIQTLGVSLQDFRDQETKRVTARVAVYSLSVKAPSLTSVGPLLAELAPVAGDALQVRGLHLTIEDPRPLLERARRAAVGDALERARQLAGAAGVRTGAILSIEEEPGSRPAGLPRRTRMSSDAVAMSASAVPVEGGTATVAIQVQIRLALGEEDPDY